MRTTLSLLNLPMPNELLLDGRATSRSRGTEHPPPFFKGWVPAPVVILYKCMLPKTNVTTLAELLAGFGSKLGELTTAVFVTDAGIGGIETRTVKLTVADAPLAMFPKLH